jgi:hypothetical protein
MMMFSGGGWWPMPLRKKHWWKEKVVAVSSPPPKGSKQLQSNICAPHLLFASLLTPPHTKNSSRFFFSEFRIHPNLYQQILINYVRRRLQHYKH